MKTIKVVLTVLTVAVLAVGTVLERYNPAMRIYDIWWFAALMALVGVAAIVGIVHGKLWRRPSRLLVHLGVVAILAGGALTSWVAKQGVLVLQPGTPTRAVVTEAGASWDLPFDVTLRNFELVHYTGTRTPMDFVSHVSVEGQDYDISMNHILRHRGYRFYQADYDDAGASTLSVSHDPWGIAFTYAGYALLLLGLLGLMVSPRGPYRRLAKGAAVAAMLLLPSVSSAATPPTLPRETADRMGRMYVLYHGRVCPVQTLAKDFTTKLTGKATYQGLTPEQVLSGYLFYYADWADEPALKIKGAKALGVSKRSSVNQLAFLAGQRQSPDTDKNTRAATEKANLVQMLLSGRMLKLFPVEGNWYGQNDDLPMTVADDEYLFIRQWQSLCQELVLKGDMQQLELVFDKTAKYQASRVTVAEGRVKAERVYNALTTGRWLPMLAITLGLIMFAYALVCQSRQRRMGRWAVVAGTVFMSLLTLFLLLIIALRWVAGGHVPMAGGFDTMNLMSLLIGVLALSLSRRNPVALPAGMLTMGFCQLVAMMSGANPPVTNLMPVLNSPLLTLHVAIIMCAYALFFFITMLGVAGLVTGNAHYRRTIMLLLYPAVFLLSLGIIVGAVWANVSWGTYWSWDPKEVWALVTLLVYALPLQEGLLRRPRAFYLYCTLAILSVAVTYFGVNLLLGGMHAYN